MCCVLPLLKVQQLFWFTTSTAVDDGCNRDNVIETFFLRLQYSFLSWDSCKKMKNFSGPTKTTHTHFERQFIKLSDETVFYAKLLWILASRASSSRNSWLFGWCSWNLTKAGNEEKKNHLQITTWTDGNMIAKNYRNLKRIVRFCTWLQFNCVIWHLKENEEELFNK